MGWTVERLAMDDPLKFDEQVGDPVADFGGTPAPAPRMALRHSVTLPTYTASAASDTVAQRLTLRRQLRSILNNSPWKINGLYVNWAADPEQNGWYVPDMGQLQDGAGDGTGLSTGYWTLANVIWRASGKRRTHRRAAQIVMLSDLAGTNPRDYLQRVYSSSDFAALTPLALTYLPPAATDVVNSNNGAAITTATLPTGSDGGACKVATGLANLSVASYEQPEASQTLTGCLAFDRLGTGGTSEATWVEVYGPDWPWYWPNTSSATPDTPVLENGYCRVRYDGTNTPGWRIDAWVGGAWVEQCKVWIQRYNSGLATPLAVADSTLLSAGLEEYTPERVVMKAVMQAGGDTSSREIIFITLQRGWGGPRFEVYPAPTATATPLAAGAWVCITPAATDSDNSAFAIYGAPSSAAINLSTALGTGHTGLFAPALINDSSGSSLSDNSFGFLRSLAAGAGGLATGNQISVAVVQAGALVEVGPSANAYAVTRNTLIVRSPNTGDYVSAHMSFPVAQAQQIMEAEDMTLGSNTSSTSDATASNGTAASTTRTSDANYHVEQTVWPGLYPAVYRLFARVRTTAGTMSVYAKITGPGGATNATVTTTSASYVWLDLGDVSTVVGNLASNLGLEIHAWTSSGTCYVDRIEAYQRQDRSGPAAQFQGTQDLGLSALFNSQVVNGIVSRA